MPTTLYLFARKGSVESRCGAVGRFGLSVAGARASSAAERRHRSSVLVGISKTPPSTSESATGISGTCSVMDRMPYWPSCFSGGWLSISFSCSAIGGLVVAADPRTLLIPSGISSRSCFANWPLSPSPLLGRLFSSRAADTAPEPRQLGGADAPAPTSS